jgi:hypothetical protein
MNSEEETNTKNFKPKQNKKIKAMKVSFVFVTQNLTNVTRDGSHC